MVYCQYIDIQYQIVTSNYMDSILGLYPAKYPPFNSIRCGNTGYLFVSNNEMMQFFIDKLLVRNAYLNDFLTLL